MKKEFLSIGKVIKPHGVRGKIKVEYFGQDWEQPSAYREVFIEDETGELKAYKILEVNSHPRQLILQLKGLEKIEEVEPLIGKEILIRREALPKLPDGEYYWIEILGMDVETEEGRRIGRVKEIFPTRANDVYVVETERGEILLPATAEVVRSIDPKRGVMRISRTEGLWEKEDEV
jgi:16S rRNA processing protein RimM